MTLEQLQAIVDGLDGPARAVDGAYYGQPCVVGANGKLVAACVTMDQARSLAAILNAVGPLVGFAAAMDTSPPLSVRAEVAFAELDAALAEIEVER